MTLTGYLLFSALLFCLGLYATIARRNLIAVLIGVELMLNAASLNFLAFGRFRALDPDHATGQIVVLFVIGLAAAEVAIALSIVLSLYRERRSIHTDDLDQLSG